MFLLTSRIQWCAQIFFYSRIDEVIRILVFLISALTKYPKGWEQFLKQIFDLRKQP